MYYDSCPVKIADFPQPPINYRGPKLINDDISCINKKWIIKLHEYQKNGKNLHIRYLVIIMIEAFKLFKSMKNIEYFSLPDDNELEYDDNGKYCNLNENRLTICGDIHGQYYDYLNIYKINGLPSLRNAYLFNGDFVDRGDMSCEVITSMLTLKILYPRHFLMIRGNHETVVMNEVYGFKNEVKCKYNYQLFNLFTELFNTLPLGYIIGNKVFVCHGGLMKDYYTIRISDLQNINRFKQPLPGSNMLDLLWSDPKEDNGLSLSYRGTSILFGPDVTTRFLQNNKLSLVIRSHQVEPEGFKLSHQTRCITIFSAPNYLNGNNRAAYIVLNKNYVPRIKQFCAYKHTKSIKKHLLPIMKCLSCFIIIISYFLFVLIAFI